MNSNSRKHKVQSPSQWWRQRSLQERKSRRNWFQKLFRIVPRRRGGCVPNNPIVGWQPQPLGPRNRTLSISCEKDNPSSQAQSLLLTALPLELRLSIYQVVLGDRTLHIILHPNKGIRHVRCGKPHTRRVECFGTVSDTGWYPYGWAENGEFNDLNKVDGDKIPLIQTCKQIFDFTDDFLTLSQFSKITLPQRIQAIACLDLRLSELLCKHNKQDELSMVEETAAILRTMTRLRELTITFRIGGPMAETKLFGPLLVLEPRSVFEIHVGWPEPPATAETIDYPFKIIRNRIQPEFG